MCYSALQDEYGVHCDLNCSGPSHAVVRLLMDSLARLGLWIGNTFFLQADRANTFQGFLRCYRDSTSGRLGLSLDSRASVSVMRWFASPIWSILEQSLVHDWRSLAVCNLHEAAA